MKSLILSISGLIVLTPMSVALAQEVANESHPIAVPEPTTLAIAAVGLVGALVASRFRKK